MITAPLGFARLDRVQSDFYARTGSVPGAAKLSSVADHVFVRLGPPKYTDTIMRRPDVAAEVSDLDVGHQVLVWYKSEYLDGWYAARAGHADRTLAGRSIPFLDGWLDNRAGRQKWHLTHCLDHERCGQ